MVLPAHPSHIGFSSLLLHLAGKYDGCASGLFASLGRSQQSPLCAKCQHKQIPSELERMHTSSVDTFRRPKHALLLRRLAKF